MRPSIFPCSPRERSSSSTRPTTASPPSSAWHAASARRGTVAVGDRVWGEAVLTWGAIVGFDRLQTGSRLVNELRRVKDADELEAMGRAIATVEQTMEAVTPLVVPGVTMAALAEAVEHELRRAGSRCPSFTTHIFTDFEPTGYDSGMTSGWTPVPEGTSVMFDFGGVVDGYCSDFGRTIYCGEPGDDYREIYDTMLAAQASGLAAAAAGALAREVNDACRRPIEEAGLGEHFRHRMGHGIGMNVHERPFLSAEDEHAARGRDDLHGRAVDHDPRPLQCPDRGHHRRRGRRRPDSEHVSIHAGRERRLNRVTRRELLAGASGLLLTGAAARHALAHLDVAEALGATGGSVQRFVSRPDLKPPTMTVLRPAQGTARGLVFLAPSSGPGQRGAMIVDDAGELVWFHPVADKAVDRLQGRAVPGQAGADVVGGQGRGTASQTGSGSFSTRRIASSPASPPRTAATATCTSSSSRRTTRRS